MENPKNERTGPTDSKMPIVLGFVAAAFVVSIVISNFLPSAEHSPSTKPRDQKISETAPLAKEAPSAERPSKIIRAGAWAKVTTAFLGCKDDADISKIVKLGRSGDSDAAARVAEEKDCKSFAVGDTGIVEHTTVWAGISCIRERGQPDCYWFPDQFLTSP